MLGLAVEGPDDKALPLGAILSLWNTQLFSDPCVLCKSQGYTFLDLWHDYLTIWLSASSLYKSVPLGRTLGENGYMYV